MSISYLKMWLVVTFCTIAFITALFMVPEDLKSYNPVSIGYKNVKSDIFSKKLKYIICFNVSPFWKEKWPLPSLIILKLKCLRSSIESFITFSALIFLLITSSCILSNSFLSFTKVSYLSMIISYLS